MTYPSKNLPSRSSLVRGKAEGKTKLEAIDNALIDAQIGDLNLIEVSSIFPADCKMVKFPSITPGTLAPTAMVIETDSEPGRSIAASISVAMGEESYGIISEFSDKDIKENTIEKKSEAMAKRMMEKRGLRIKDIKTISISHEVRFIGAVVVALVFFDGD